MILFNTIFGISYEIVYNTQNQYLFSFIVTFVHASLRLRNLRNKLVNKIEGIGLKRTPMGLFLEHLGMEQELFA